jgi:hypothetical protein
MIAAMHKRTKIGCEKLIQEAINNCPVPTIQNYIRRNYMRNTQQWALWARQHSPLLLQVTSTNPLESYHRKGKGNTKGKGEYEREKGVRKGKRNTKGKEEYERERGIRKGKGNTKGAMICIAFDVTL